MKQISTSEPTPWDTNAFGIPTWHLTEYSIPALRNATVTPGHYAISVPSLADKSSLHEYGFYYCDTLIEPVCTAARLRGSEHPDATLRKPNDVNEILSICHSAFVHGRFHRDFCLAHDRADLRYDNWLMQLYSADQVSGLYWQDQLAGFIAWSGNKLVLHALAEAFRGRGLAKYWWTNICSKLLSSGYHEVTSSISAANCPAVNLYASLGFSFRNPRDYYHRLVK